jgi:hypothetical protein
MTYILWQFRGDEEWVEVARASSLNWEWSLVLRGPAWRLLNPESPLIDLDRRVDGIADRILDYLVQQIEPELREIQGQVLHIVAEAIAGRIACLR